MTSTIFATLFAEIIAAAFVVHLDAATVSVITGPVIPILTGLLTKSTAPTWVKQVVTLFLAAAAGVVSQAVGEDGTAVLSQAALVHAALAYVLAVATYLGLFKRDGVSINDVLAPNFGIGPKNDAIDTTAVDVPAEPPAIEPAAVAPGVEPVGPEPAGEWPPPVDNRPGANNR